MSKKKPGLLEQMRAFIDSPAFQQITQSRLALMKREESVAESAEWFGRTGLDEQIERELPRYLRREFGESLFDANSLKAADLEYMGAFDEDGTTVHYWRIPPETSGNFATVTLLSIGPCTSWGKQAPPPLRLKA